MWGGVVFFFLIIRRPPRSPLDRSSAASDVYKRQVEERIGLPLPEVVFVGREFAAGKEGREYGATGDALSLIHISEPTRPY